MDFQIHPHARRQPFLGGFLGGVSCVASEVVSVEVNAIVLCIEPTWMCFHWEEMQRLSSTTIASHSLFNVRDPSQKCNA